MMLALGAALGVLACDDDDGPGGVGPTTEQQVVVRVVSGTGLHGVQLDLRHGVEMTATAVEQLGPLALAECASNPEAGRLRVACVLGAGVAAPFDAWRVTFAVPAGFDALTSITAVDCTGSDATGLTSDIACDLSS
jgi:hypothetical protein